MKTTDFANALSSFLSVYLPTRKNLSANTISSYCDTFKLIFKYINDVKQLPVERITLEDFNYELISDFLNWLETDRKCGKSTVNQRLAAIHSFFKYVPSLYPAYIANCQNILSVPFQKKIESVVSYLEADDVKLILSFPDVATKQGRRDLVLLSLLYDSGMRVSEIISLTPRSVRISAPAQIEILGKGRKARIIPILRSTASLLEQYLRERRLTNPEDYDKPLFINNQRECLSRAGVTYILKKYCKLAASV